MMEEFFSRMDEGTQTPESVAPDAAGAIDKWEMKRQLYLSENHPQFKKDDQVIIPPGIEFWIDSTQGKGEAQVRTGREFKARIISPKCERSENGRIVDYDKVEVELLEDTDGAPKGELVLLYRDSLRKVDK